MEFDGARRASREEDGMTTKRARYARAIRRIRPAAATQVLLCLLLVILGAIGSDIVQTSGGNLQVESLTIPGRSGETVSADLYKPISATEKHRAPMVIVTPGFQRTKETQISYSLELARRGIATLVIDPYNQGESSSQVKGDSDAAIFPAIEAVTKTTSFAWVDDSRIGIVGHSAGGSAVRRAAAHYGALEAKALKRARDSDSDGGETVTRAERAHAEALNKIRSVFISGWLQNLTPKSFANIHSNIGLGYAKYDEGGYRNIQKNGDLRTAPEALAMINSGLPKSEHISKIDIGRGYGNVADRTYRVAYNDTTIHPFQPLYPPAIASMISFFTTSLDWHTDLAPTNQTWWLKEVFNLVSLIGAFLMLLPLTRVLLRIPALAGAAQPVPAPQPRQTAKGRLVFWSTFALTAVIACVTFIPLSDTTAVIFPQASNSINTWLYPARMINAVLLWAVVNGTIGIAIFLLSHRFFGRRAGGTAPNWGVRMRGSAVVKTLAIAALLIATFYTLLAVCYGVFHSDYRFLVVAARPLSAKWFFVALEYIPLLFIFYFANSLRVNAGGRFENQKKWVGYLIAALGNSVGLAAIFVIQYVTFATTGTVFWTTDWLYVNMLQSILPMMFILPLFNRAFFDITGRVWLGPIVTVTIFSIMSLGASVIYLPMP